MGHIATLVPSLSCEHHFSWREFEVGDDLWVVSDGVFLHRNQHATRNDIAARLIFYELNQIQLDFLIHGFKTREHFISC